MRLNKNMVCELVWEFIKSELSDVTKSINDRLTFDKEFYWKGSVMDRTCEYIRNYLKETIAFRDVLCSYKGNNTVETLLYFDDSSIPSMIVVPMSGVRDTGFNPNAVANVPRETPVEAPVEEPVVEPIVKEQINEAEVNSFNSVQINKEN